MRKPRLILVGEAPSHGDLSTRPGLVLTGSSGRNLCKIAGWDWTEYLGRTERRNLFLREMPEWDANAAFLAARQQVLEIAGRGIKTVILGSRVKAAFEASLGMSIPSLRFVTAGKRVGLRDLRFSVAHVPHPSGLNRVWNDPSRVEEAREFLKDMLK